MEIGARHWRRALLLAVSLLAAGSGLLIVAPALSRRSERLDGRADGDEQPLVSSGVLANRMSSASRRKDPLGDDMGELTALASPAFPGPVSPSASEAQGGGLVLYEHYYSKQAWPVLHDEPPFRPVGVISSRVRLGSGDIDAAQYVEAIKDATYQGLLCEYGAIFAVANQLRPLPNSPSYIGFQSWRAYNKKVGLSKGAILGLATHAKQLEMSGDRRAFFFWAAWGQDDLYTHCNHFHVSCDVVYSATFKRLFHEAGPLLKLANASAAAIDPDFLPPMAGGACNLNAISSYFAMHASAFAEYARLARMFVVTMESIWDLHGNLTRCPLSFVHVPRRYNHRLCYCFILERLVNIFAVHSGLRIFYVHPDDGSAEHREQHRLSGRQMWSHWFSGPRLQELAEGFVARLSPDQEALYRQLGG